MRIDLNSIWVNAKGQVDTLESIGGQRTSVYRVCALDTLGWVNIRAVPQQIEIWLNPLSVTRLALAGAEEVISQLRVEDPERCALIEVYDGGHRATLPLLSEGTLSSLYERGIAATKAPGHPLRHESGSAGDAWELKDARARDLLKYAHDRNLRATSGLVERVDDCRARAKIILVTPGGSVQYLAHDKYTLKLWESRSRFVGRFLDRLPFPSPIKRSLQADAAAAFESRQTTVTRVSQVWQVLGRHQARCDSYLRVVVPLMPKNSNNEIPMLVLLSGE